MIQANVPVRNRSVGKVISSTKKKKTKKTGT